MIVDLRSDTVTKPTDGMLNAMMRAEVGDDVYGEDQTVRALEDRTAALLGKEAGLFTPSGTMANQIAIALHTTPGSSVIAEAESHVYLYEAGAAAALSGVQFDLIPFADKFSDEAIDEHLQPADLHHATTSLLVVENTHNRGGGRVLNVAETNRICTRGRHHGLRLHCDGARIWNAAAALKVKEIDLARPFDTVSVCYSKGLGAPVGSVLVGPKDLIERARKIRKRWGGGMRQAGYLAAGALYALENHRERLIDDHRRIDMLYHGIQDLNTAGFAITCVLPDIYTNILYFKVPGQNSSDVEQALKNEGVLMNDLGGGKLRAVTHLHIDDKSIEHTLKALKRVVAKRK